MTFAVSSPVGRSGKITVRAPTPEAALAWAGKLRILIERRSVTSIATGVQLSEELKARVLKHDLNGGNERSLNAVLHGIRIRFFKRIYIVMIGPARGSPLVLEASERSEGA